MTFHDSAATPINPQYRVGVAIRVVNRRHQAFHVGIVYKRESGEVYFADLRSHHECHDTPVDDSCGYYWSDCSWLGHPGMSDASTILAAYVQSCAGDRLIPYSPLPPTEPFDAYGRYQRGNHLEGFTCASYVHAVFKGGGYDVLRIQTWIPRPGDGNWWQVLRPHLGEPRATELRNVEFHHRLRPEEIAAAAASPQIPLDYLQTIAISDPLSQHLLR